jgi:Na+/glutamate symporter
MTNTTFDPPQLRAHAPKILAGLAALAVVLVLATALTSMTASTTSGLFVGVIVGGSLAVLGAQRKSRAAQARSRQADESALDGLEPLRRDRTS